MSRREVEKQLREWRNSPEGRLTAEGASSRKQIERRVLWLSHEWQLPRCPKIGRTMSKALREYVKAHGISYDWLLLGDLKGLQRMMQGRRERACGRPTQKDRIMASYHAMTPDQQRIIDDEVKRMLEERDPA